MTAHGITVDHIRDEVYDDRERRDCDCGHQSFVVTLKVRATMEEPGYTEGYCECNNVTVCEDGYGPLYSVCCGANMQPEMAGRCPSCGDGTTVERCDCQGCCTCREEG